MDLLQRFVILASVMVLPTAAGYVVRRSGLIAERFSKLLMTGVVVCGYSSVAFLGIWGAELDVSSIWLPSLAAAHVLVMLGLGLAAGRVVRRRRADIGLFGLSAGLGNNGTTMGAFVAFILYGQQGLGLASVYCLMWTPMMVLVAYPVARHYADDSSDDSLGRLMLRCIFDIRSIGLPIAITAVLLSISGLPQPAAVEKYHIIDILFYLVMVMAFFAIGLRLHVSSVRKLKVAIASLAVMRFVVAAGVGLALVFLTRFTPWPLTGMARNVYLVQSCVPMAVTVVGVANMFSLKPKDASALFVTNTLTYLVIVLPIVLWLFSE